MLASVSLGFGATIYQLMATEGTALRIEAAGIQVQHVKKLQEGHPNLLDYPIGSNSRRRHTFISAFS